MKKRRLFLSAVLLLCATILLSSCSTVQVTRRTSGPGIGNGPPAHAPAYGHRRKSESSTTIVIKATDMAGEAYAVEDAE